jgi:ubiquinone/menaquinone biosynthesis C-methylase UbiE/uncharacterized membrane protein
VPINSWHIEVMSISRKSIHKFRVYNFRKFALACLLALQLSACGKASAPEIIYTNGPKSSAGTGRYYMDREIANVMSYRGADWLERAEREQLERIDLTLKNMALSPSSVVADIGAGSGYFSRRIARLIPDGEVIAVDIQPQMLAILTTKAAEENISNIRTVLAQEKSPNLARGSIDLAIMVDVYHELKWPREVMLKIKEALKPGGRVILIEYRAEDKSISIIPIHKMSEAQARKELGSVGFELAENLDFLPSQHFLVFTAADSNSNNSGLNTLAWNCTNSGYVVTDQSVDSDTLWIFLPGETLKLNANSTAEGSEFVHDQIMFRYAGQQAELSVEGIVENCTENRRASIREDAKLRGVDFWATGNEPPWQLELGSEKILLKTGYEPSITVFPPATPIVNADSSQATYSTRGKDSLLEVKITGGNCIDSMSGEHFASSVTIRLEDKIFRGCGKALH